MREDNPSRASTADHRPSRFSMATMIERILETAGMAAAVRAAERMAAGENARAPRSRSSQASEWMRRAAELRAADRDRAAAIAQVTDFLRQDSAGSKGQWFLAFLVPELRRQADTRVNVFRALAKSHPPRVGGDTSSSRLLRMRRTVRPQNHCGRAASLLRS